MEKERSSEIDEVTVNSGSFLLPETAVQGSKWWKFSMTIEPIVFLLFFADAFAESVTSNFILLRTCENRFHYNHSICSGIENLNSTKSDIEAKIQPYSTLITTCMNFISAFLPAIISLFAGPWSDLNGRKPVILISSVGYLTKYLLMMILTYFPQLGPEYVLLAVFPLSLCGGIINFISSIFSYISDITTEDNRFFRISVIEAVVYLAISFGLVVLSSSFEIHITNRFTTTYGICAGAVFLSVVYTYFFLPESLTITETGKGLRDVFDLKHLREMFDICFRKRRGTKRLCLFMSMAVLTIAISVGAGNSNVLYYFTRLRFGWEIKEYTFWASITLPVLFIGIFLGIFLFSKWLKIPEALLGLLGCVSQTVTYFYIAFIPSDKPSLMYYTCLVNLFGGIVGPMCRLLLSKSASKEDLGKVFALTGSSESIFPLLVGPLYTTLYNATINILPSAFLMLTASLNIVCCVLFLIIHFTDEGPKREEDEVVENRGSSSTRSSPARDSA